MDELKKAKAEIDERLTSKLREEFGKQIPDYFKALEIASKSIEAQLRLNEMMEFVSTLNHCEKYSAGIVLGMLNEIKYNWGAEVNE